MTSRRREVSYYSCRTGWALNAIVCQPPVTHETFYAQPILFFFFLIYFSNPLREIRAALLQPQEQRYPVLQFMLGLFVFPQSTELEMDCTGSLTCVRDHCYECIITHGGWVQKRIYIYIFTITICVIPFLDTRAGIARRRPRPYPQPRLQL